MMQINEKNYVDKAEAAITRLSKMVNRQVTFRRKG